MSTKMPILAWRTWYVHRDNGLRGLHNVRWDHSQHLATCKVKHQVPDKHCLCGIYATTNPKDALIAAFPFQPKFIFSRTLLILVLFFCLSINLSDFLSHNPLVNYDLLFTFLVMIGILVVWGFYRRAEHHILGLVQCSGRILKYPKGIRAQQAKIVALVRPTTMSLKVSQQISKRLNVPLFELEDIPILLAQASEHGEFLV